MPEITAYHGNDSSTSFSINTCGATVTSWKVRGEERLFVSSIAKRDGSKAIRGGIPLCFPQFGPWDDGRPQHGFARGSNKWEVKEEQSAENGDQSVVMVLGENEETKKLWNHSFVFTYTVTLTTNELKLEAAVENKGTNEFDLTFCFHTYFRVDNIANAKVKGLDGLTYVDKTQAGKRVVEDNKEVCISGFVDRVYENAPDKVELQLGGKKTVTLTKENLRDFVVWNPWSTNCEKMGDMDNDGYLYMICVEAAQTSERASVKPGSTWKATHRLSFQ